MHRSQLDCGLLDPSSLSMEKRCVGEFDLGEIGGICKEGPRSNTSARYLSLLFVSSEINLRSMI